MAEIYTYSASASGGHMSPDTSDHINSVLSDLGLGGTAADSVDTSRSGVESVGSTPEGASATPSPVEASASEASFDHAGSILAGSPADSGAHAAAAEPQAETFAPAPTHATDPAPAFAAPAGADSVPGAHAAYGSEAFGGLGTDTLWGSDGGTAHSLAALPPTPAGSDTIRSSGGMETIYGGNATIYASGHSATLHTDTVHASGEGTTMDGSASAQVLHTDGASSFADLPGGSGSDTIRLHDGTGSFVPASGEEAHAASAYPAYDGYGSGAHDAGYGYGTPDSVVAGDGSDHFALLGYGALPDGYDAGSADDGSAAHHDPYLAGGHVTHTDFGTFVSYNDGYDAGYSDPDQLQFKDTVMAG